MLLTMRYPLRMRPDARSNSSTFHRSFEANFCE